MRDLEKFKKKGIADFAFQAESQVIVGKDPGDQAAAVPVNPGGYPLGEDDRPGLFEPFFFPVREGPAGAEDIDVFTDAGMEGGDHINIQGSRGPEIKGPSGHNSGKGVKGKNQEKGFVLYPRSLALY